MYHEDLACFLCFTFKTVTNGNSTTKGCATVLSLSCIRSGGPFRNLLGVSFRCCDSHNCNSALSVVSSGTLLIASVFCCILNKIK